MDEEMNNTPEENKENKEREEMKKKHNEHSHNSENKGVLTEKMRENPWMPSTFVLGILALVLLIGNFGGAGITGNVISENVAADKILEFVNSQVDGEVELVNVGMKNGLYEVNVLYQGREIPVYITSDGESLVQGLTPLDALSGQTSQQEPVKTDYTEEELVKIKEFSQCLADNGVKAYGAEWCGYCKKLKEAFGGIEQITPFYYECQNADRTPTENAELCEEEQITGFPTIKINGESYSGARTIEGLASAVEACDAPEFEEATSED